MRRAPLASLAALIAAGGAVRLATLGVQSLWYDESVTAGLVHRSFTGMLSAIPGSESTPPLFYALLWPWTRLFGHGEAGLRSLSTLAGTATIGVAFLVGRRLAGERAGLIAALLTAANPLLIWYSQEARAYALLVLLSALALLAFLTALERPDRRALGWWAAATVLALATHYFAVFPAVAEAAWLLRRHGRRARAPVAVTALAGLALAPLLIDQAGDSRAKFISESPLATRLAQVPKQFLVGYRAPAQVLLGLLAIALALAGAAWLACRRAEPPVRATALVLLTGIGLPLAGALAGADYLIARNLLALLVPLLALLAAGFASARSRAGAVAAVALTAVGLLAFVLVETHPLDQRPDAGGAARALGSTSGGTLVLGATNALEPVSLYLRGARLLAPGRTATVRDVAWIRLTPEGGVPAGGVAPGAPGVPPALRLVSTVVRPTYSIMRWRADRPLPLGLASFSAGPQGLAVLAVPAQLRRG